MTDHNGSFSHETEYKQICMTIRHYSNLRFLIIPIFVAINGALFIAVRGDKTNQTHDVYFAMFIFSLIIFCVFIYLEYVLNKYYEVFIKRAIEINPNSFWRARLPTGDWVSRSICALYLSVTLSWLALAALKLNDLF